MARPEPPNFPSEPRYDLPSWERIPRSEAQALSHWLAAQFTAVYAAFKLEAEQLARLNEQIALVQESVDALAERMERIEHQRRRHSVAQAPDT